MRTVQCQTPHLHPGTRPWPKFSPDDEESMRFGVLALLSRVIPTNLFPWTSVFLWGGVWREVKNGVHNNTRLTYFKGLLWMRNPQSVLSSVRCPPPHHFPSPAPPQAPSGFLTRWHSVGIIWSLQQVPRRAAALSGISARDKNQSLSKKTKNKKHPWGQSQPLDCT